MSYQERYHEWFYQLAAIMHNKNEEERRRNKLIAAVYINECINLKRKYKKKRFWIDPLFEKRREYMDNKWILLCLCTKTNTRKFPELLSHDSYSI